LRSPFNIILSLVCLSMLVMATKNKNEIKLTKARSEGRAEKPSAESTYSAVMGKAKLEGSRVVLVFGAGWCVWCQKLESETLTALRVKSKMYEMKVVKLKVDIEKNKDIAMRYNVKSIPVLVLVDGDEKVIGRRDGYMNVKDMLSWLNLN